MIKLDSEWNIDADADNWILAKGKRKRYYPTLKLLCNGWMELRLREGVADNTVDLTKVVAVETAESAVRAQLEALFKGAVGDMNRKR